MKKYWIILIIGALLPSCATILNTKKVSVNILSQPGDSLVFYLNKDFDKTYQTPAMLSIKRSKAPLTLTVQKDSIQKDILIKSKVSNMYIFGNIFPYGVGYVLDLFSDKRFTYPQKIIINSNSLSLSTPRKKKIYTPGKGQVDLKVSVPLANFMLIKKNTDYVECDGFLGIAGGVNYYLTDKWRINSDVGFMMNYPIPFPVGICGDDEGEHENVVSFFTDLQIGSYFYKNTFHYDLGIQYSQTRYQYTIKEGISGLNYPTEPYSRYCYERTKHSLGPAFTFDVHPTKLFYFGVNYYPSFFNWQDGQFRGEYTHTLSIDFGFKFSIRKKVK